MMKKYRLKVVKEYGNHYIIIEHRVLRLFGLIEFWVPYREFEELSERADRVPELIIPKFNDLPDARKKLSQLMHEEITTFVDKYKYEE